MSVLHSPRLLRNGNVPHPTGHGHIRAASFPPVRDKVSDGRFRTVFQPDGKLGETALQLLRLLPVELAPFGGQAGSFPESRPPFAFQGGLARRLRKWTGNLFFRHLTKQTQALPEVDFLKFWFCIERIEELYYMECRS